MREMRLTVLVPASPLTHPVGQMYFASHPSHFNGAENVSIWGSCSTVSPLLFPIEFFAGPLVNVKFCGLNQLKYVRWQQKDLCFVLRRGIRSVLCKTILRRPGFCEFLKRLERVFSTVPLMIDYIFFMILLPLILP